MKTIHPEGICPKLFSGGTMATVKEDGDGLWNRLCNAA